MQHVYQTKPWFYCDHDNVAVFNIWPQVTMEMSIIINTWYSIV